MRQAPRYPVPARHPVPPEAVRRAQAARPAPIDHDDDGVPRWVGWLSLLSTVIMVCGLVYFSQAETSAYAVRANGDHVGNQGLSLEKYQQEADRTLRAAEDSGDSSPRWALVSPFPGTVEEPKGWTIQAMSEIFAGHDMRVSRVFPAAGQTVELPKPLPGRSLADTVRVQLDTLCKHADNCHKLDDVLLFGALVRATPAELRAVQPEVFAVDVAPLGAEPGPLFDSVTGSLGISPLYPDVVISADASGAPEAP